ncbi:hypothetical protein GQ457_04G019930 [Hibiscus cannabinus]
MCPKIVKISTAVATLDATSHVLAADPVIVDDEKDVLVHGGAAVVDIVSGDVLAVDTMGKVHVSDHGILGDENDVLVTHSSNLEIASIKVASNFETIDEWFAEADESTVPVVVEPPLLILAKRSSGCVDSSKLKRARSSTPTSKEMRTIKAWMSSSKNSMAVVDRQPPPREIRIFYHDVIFLSDTRLSKSRNLHLKYVFKMLGCFTVDFTYACSGLILLWNNNVTVDLLSYSQHHIDVIVTSPTEKFHFSGIYGYADATFKYKTWELIDLLSASSDLPWLTGGDLNENLSDREKQGGRRRNPIYISNFRDCLSRQLLSDCKPSKGWFTWTRMGPNSITIRERLDRFLASSSWLLSFPNFNVYSKFYASSDHCFIVLNTVMDTTLHTTNNNFFHFENCWAQLPEGISLVKSVWTSSLGSTLDKLSIVGQRLKIWQDKKRHYTLGRIQFLTRQIDRSLQYHITPRQMVHIAAFKTELCKLLRSNEIYWAQHSRICWLPEGDKNTQFFHTRASRRRKKNYVHGLYNSDNIWEDGFESVLCIASTYFSSLFTSYSTMDPSILNLIPPSISAEMNQSLLRPFTPEEVTAAFQDIGTRKAPGIDGFPISFFRLHWETIGSEFIQLCLVIIDGSADMAQVNRAVIVLIPKVKNPESMCQFRPISLCTVIYKTVSKVLVNQMKPMLLQCISTNQYAFVAGRNITDNILLAHEILQSLTSVGTGPY